jgi:hypothetical protein
MPQLDKVIFFSQFVHFVVLFFTFYAIMIKFILPNFIKLANIRQTIAEKEFLYYGLENKVELMSESPLYAPEFGSILAKLKTLRHYHNPNIQIFYINSLKNCFTFSSSASQTTIHLFQKWFFFSRYNIFLYFKTLDSTAVILESDALLSDSNDSQEA